MNKIFLLIAIFICSLGHAKGNYNILGVGQNDCGEFLEVYEQSLKEYDDDYLEFIHEATLARFTDYAKGVITSTNYANMLVAQVYKMSTYPQFAPQDATLERLLYKNCNENLTTSFHMIIESIYVKNQK
jgi:hypothetical protein